MSTLDSLNQIIETLPASDNQPHKHMEAAARHISKYMFPLQYGLHNVFTCTLSYWENGGHFRDYGDREAEIEVLRYLKIVVDEVIPHAFWGSVANRQAVDTRETKDRRVCQSDSLKRVELLREFVYWFFDSFLMPLIRTSFYVTETSALQHQLLYFRHDDWHTLCIPLLAKLSGETFERIDPSELDPSRRLGVSHVRLLPKETGVRPIVNLGRKARVKQVKIPGTRQNTSPKDESLRSSVNQVLNAAFNILNYEKTQKPEMLGASVFGSNDIYRKLSAFKSSVLQPDGSMPKLYFAKLDVRACFDTIEQDKLLSILRQSLTQDGYMIRKFTRMQFSTGQTRRTFQKKAVPDLEHTHFMAYAARLAASLRHVVFADQAVYGFDYQEEILELLEEHITDNIVRIGHDLYRQVVGIPQGSILSTLLCAIFYGNLEETELRFTQDPGNVLLRFVDDYLFITTDIRVARKFLKIMHRGHPEYGCEVAEEKTLTNFADAEVQTLVLAPENELLTLSRLSMVRKNHTHEGAVGTMGL
ncbi:hypothetical protein FRC07_006702 [Ceratobasidium sp. 392]|nr:hypothetical protein FRC07_006702 [Ceratobasidium sp. 392]